MTRGRANRSEQSSPLTATDGQTYPNSTTNSVAAKATNDTGLTKIAHAKAANPAKVKLAIGSLIQWTQRFARGQKSYSNNHANRSDNRSGG